MIFLLVVDGGLNLLEIGAQEVSNFEMWRKGGKIGTSFVVVLLLFVCFEDDMKDIALKKCV